MTHFDARRAGCLSALLIAGSAIGWQVASAQAPVARVGIKTLSTDAAIVTGGDVLVEISLPAGASPRITLDGRNVGKAFRSGTQPRTLVGVVTGLANGKNPISIIVPCHRVIGANGALTGFGGGIEVKRQLLALEQGEPLLRC